VFFVRQEFFISTPRGTRETKDRIPTDVGGNPPYGALAIHKQGGGRIEDKDRLSNGFLVNEMFTTIDRSANIIIVRREIKEGVSFGVDRM